MGGLAEDPLHDLGNTDVEQQDNDGEADYEHQDNGRVRDQFRAGGPDDLPDLSDNLPEEEGEPGERPLLLRRRPAALGRLG